MTTLATTIINGIEIKEVESGTVEIFADRPSLVRVSDLIEVLTASSGTEVASQTDSYFPQSPCNQPAG